MLTIFFVIFLDIVGFSIIIPIFFYHVENMGASPALGTALMALYSGALLFSTPVLGRISDYYGRRPVMLICMSGAFVGNLMLGFADSLWLIALSRVICGAMAGNISAAQAYITDITAPEERAKGMGVIGAAIGLGFILGPSLGSWMGGDNFEETSLFLPAMFSACMCACAFLAVFFLLPESLNPQHRDELRAQPRVSLFTASRQVMVRALVAQIIICGLLFNIASGLAESIFPIWVKELKLIDGPSGMLPMFLCSGLLLAIIQGGLVGPLVKRFGEHSLLKFGAIVYCVGTGLVTLAGDAGNYYFLIAAMALQSTATAFVVTPLQSLVSQCAADTERGMVMGLYSSVGTLGRTMGPLFTGLIYTHIYYQAPYYSAMAIAVLLLLLAIVLQRRWQREIPAQSLSSA